MRHGSLPLAASLVIAALCAPACSGHTDTARSGAATTDPRLEGANRLERNGWIYVHLQGPPAQLGFQHGYLLAPEITDLLRVTKPFT
jgi:poly(3-hydroxybutyrate) depolymerase